MSVLHRIGRNRKHKEGVMSDRKRRSGRRVAGVALVAVAGLVRGQFGQGVIASIAILALGIALDRVTQGARQARKEDIA